MSKSQGSRKKAAKLQPFGAATDADNTTSQIVSDITSSAPCTREVPSYTVPPLSSICIKKFANWFVRLRNDDNVWKRMAQILHLLPDHLVSKLFSLLQSTVPTYLRHEFITAYFFRGSSISLTDALTGVNRRTIIDIPRINSSISELELSGFGSISDSDFSLAIHLLPKLQVLVLRRCTQVGVQTTKEIVGQLDGLRVLNLNYTSVTPASLLKIVTRHKTLEVLKLAGLQNWTDAKMTSQFTSQISGEVMLPNIHTLKLRHLPITDGPVTTLVGICNPDTLKRLDVSFTGLRSLTGCFLVRYGKLQGYPDDPDAYSLPIEKLNIGSTPLRDLQMAIPLFPHLRILSLSALRTSTTDTLTDEGLRRLTEVLEPLAHIEDINLAMNTKLCKDSAVQGSAMNYFLTRVGRRCKKLNFAGILSLRSSDLAGLVSETGNPDDRPAIETLVLTKTGVDDDSTAFLICCQALKSLNVSGTKLTSSGLFLVLNACPDIVSLDVTSCRGVKVVDRRRFFEVWESQRQC
ncbi:RNI-like protein [Pluteus cervinus]|uniref:RNI-like protein n=1 Tax=Pluteus cervinus TaxID=181527 RepID=A0ACD3BH89_9AGAR|nr:RNI-like protein [Pluteus cervinus]